MHNLKNECGCFDSYITKKKANFILSHLGRMSMVYLRYREYIRIFSVNENLTAPVSQRSNGNNKE